MKTYFSLVFIFCFILSIITFAQEEQIDSLRTAFREVQSDSSKVAIFQQLATQYAKNQERVDSALAIHGRIISIQEASGEEQKIAEAYRNRAKVFHGIRDYPRAQGDYFVALSIYDKLKDSREQALTYLQLGSLFIDKEEGLPYSRKAFSIYKELNDSLGMSRSLSSISVTYWWLGRYEERKEIRKRAIELMPADAPPSFQATMFNNIGYIHYDESKYDSAIYYFNRALEISRQNNFSLDWYTINLGKAYLGKGDVDRALSLGSEGFQMAEDKGKPFTIRYAAEFMKDVLAEAGDYKSAYKMYHLYVELNDSLNNVETQKTTLQNQLKFEHEKEILTLEKEQEKKEATTRLIIIFVSIGLVVVIVFLFILFKRLRTIRKQNTIISSHRKRMEDELNFGKSIQMSMMPLTFPVFPERKEIDIYAALYPASELGGDFFDFFFTAKNKLCFVIGDVSGHGVASALQMAVSKTLINSKALTDSSTAAILTLVNDELSKNNDSSMFVTMFLGILNLETGALTYTNAGHNPPYIKRNNGSIERLDTLHGPVVGAVADLEYKESASTLLKNDAIILYTDGITEAMDTEKNLFTEKRLVEIISSQSKSSKDVVQRTVKAVKEFENEAEQADDITILAIKFLG